jgi:hypothetical protein
VFIVDQYEFNSRDSVNAAVPPKSSSGAIIPLPKNIPNIYCIAYDLDGKGVFFWQKISE